MSTVFDTLRGLVTFGPIVPGTAAQSEVVEHIKNWYSHIGWDSDVQKFESAGIPFSNVICRPRIDIEAPITIIGAHFDTKPDTDGANDNKSSTAVVLEIAKRLAKENCDHVITVHFDGEESIGLKKRYVEFDEEGNVCFDSMFYGSIHFVKKVVDEGIALGDFTLTREKIEKSIILDMCGARDADHVLSFAGDQRVINLIYRTARKLGFDDLISRYLLDGWSDQTPFFLNGIPTAMMADIYKKPVIGPPDLRIYTIRHTKEDSIDKIDPSKLENIMETVYQAALTHI